MNFGCLSGNQQGNHTTRFSWDLGGEKIQNASQNSEKLDSEALKDIKIRYIEPKLCMHQISRKSTKPDIKFKKFIIYNLRVIQELCSNHDTGDKQAMNIEGIDGQGGLPLNEPIKINIRNNETSRATICILENSFKIALN